MTFVRCLESTADGTTFPAGTVRTFHADRPIVVRYDLAAVRAAVSRDAVGRRPATIWKWRELLPHRDDAAAVRLGEAATPLLSCERLARELSVRKLWVKDESSLPTGSFKARGMAVAVTMAKELGIERVAAPTAGNAGGALAAYAARAGIGCTLVMPEDTPVVNVREAQAYGARTFLADGLIHRCGAIVAEGARRGLWFDLSTMKEPYRLEGKKTMGLELCEQLGWRLPDAILYPTGGGTGLIGMWKAFAELRELGWLDAGERLPRLFACQADGCAPIVRAFARGAEAAEAAPDARTAASGLRVPKPFADRLILAALRESGGGAFAAPEERLLPWVRRAMAAEGVALCPEAAACLDGLEQARRSGAIGADAEVVVFNTGAAQKYVEFLSGCGEPPRLRCDAVDWDLLAE